MNIKTKKEIKEGGRPGYLERFIMLIMGPGDLCKDVVYILFYPHVNIFITFLLYMSIFGPFTFIWVKEKDALREKLEKGQQESKTSTEMCEAKKSSDKKDMEQAAGQGAGGAAAPDQPAGQTQA